ncbi:MAG TPA: response regulator transcription factor [Candidatus Methylomirabilis sp.]|nr:response regulator transcription factor [Candidatus Methylomirabilis sp.]
MPIRILVADDHHVVRAGLRALLESKTGWQVCAEASNGREAVEKAGKFKPDVAVLDIAMPMLNGVEATRQIRRLAPKTEILILTMHDSDTLVQEVMEAGALGYVLKDDADRDLLFAVDALTRHQRYLSPRASSAASRAMPGPGAATSGDHRRSRLTPREREILQLLAEGKGNKEVADLLGISVKTAETHRANIMLKMDFHSITELVRYAVRNKIIQS